MIFNSDIPDTKTIDVRATRLELTDGLRTTAADIVGNYLLHRRIAYKGTIGKVIDYHIPPKSRQSITLVLQTGRTVTLYLPTRFEVGIKRNQHTENKHPRCWNNGQIAVVGVCMFWIGALFFALVNW